MENGWKNVQDVMICSKMRESSMFMFTKLTERKELLVVIERKSQKVRKRSQLIQFVIFAENLSKTCTNTTFGFTTKKKLFVKNVAMFQ